MRVILLASLVCACAPRHAAPHPAGVEATKPPSQASPSPAESQDSSTSQVTTNGVWSPLVLQLFELDHRDEALRSLLEQGKYAEPPAYVEDEPRPVKGTVVCPQPGKPPLVAVFLREEYEPDAAAPDLGHFVLFRPDGTIIPFWNNANVVSTFFGDVNGDGLVEYVDTGNMLVRGVTVPVLRIIPVQEPLAPTFGVGWNDETIELRLSRPSREQLTSIQLVRKGKGSVLASYTFDLTEQQWKGPSGSSKEGFLRFEGQETSPLSSLGIPDCLDLAEQVVREIPEVKKMYADAPDTARPGTITWENTPGRVSFSLGFHHDDHFEAAYHADVDHGVLSVSGPMGLIVVPQATAEEVRAACTQPARASKALH